MKAIYSMYLLNHLSDLCIFILLFSVVGLIATILVVYNTGQKVAIDRSKQSKRLGLLLFLPLMLIALTGLTIFPKEKETKTYEAIEVVQDYVYDIQNDLPYAMPNHVVNALDYLEFHK